jgi:hypothetical protein
MSDPIQVMWDKVEEGKQILAEAYAKYKPAKVIGLFSGGR